MRPTVIRHAKDPADSGYRARRVATILAAGLERLLGGDQGVGVEDGTALDYGGKPSVTTDCRADGSAQESDDIGD